MKTKAIAGEYKSVRRQLVKAAGEGLVAQFENRVRELLFLNASWLMQSFLELERARAIKATETHAATKPTSDTGETVETRENANAETWEGAEGSERVDRVPH
jgi:hypothetical protein